VMLAHDDALDVGEALVPGLLDLRHEPLSENGGCGEPAVDRALGR
jgi:hypothetical protein